MIDLGALANSVDSEAPGFVGKWHTIEFQPELDVPQSFVIGVALSAKGRLLGFRVAEDATRLKCFYGNRFSQETWGWLRNELLIDLQRAKDFAIARYESSSPQIRFGQGQYASGTDHLSVLARTFDRVVTVTKLEPKPRSAGVPQLELRAQLADLLKVRLGVLFESVHQDGDFYRLMDGDAVHTFDVNYDDSKIASSIVSASYVSLEKAQLNFSTSMSDLVMFNRLRPREQLGIAILVPSANTLPRASVYAWEKWWDNMSYKLKESDLMLLAESERPEELAEMMQNWYMDAAS
ncbi:hypothetical protein GCM10027082_36400 [Comamonas humi]